MAQENPKTLQISRLDAVKRQLDMAVRAHLQFDDPISALTLAGAAERVLSDLQPKNGILGEDAWSIRALCNLHIKEKHQIAAANLLRDGYDYLRHADRPARQQDLKLNPYTVDFYLLLAIKAYQQKAQLTTPPMQAFGWWAAMAHPNWISEQFPARETLAAVLNDFPSLSKSVQFQILLGFIESKSQVPNPKSLT